MLIEVHLTQRITKGQLEDALDAAAFAMDRSPSSETHLLLIDALTADGYDQDARQWFMRVWGPKNRHRVDKIAIVAKNVILRMAATTVGLATGYRIDAFSSEGKARDWLTAAPKKR